MTEQNIPIPPAIEAEQLVYAYPDGMLALQGLSISVKPGESICLAGPNGAGKTTLLLVLAGLLRAKGRVLVDGLKPTANQLLGLVFQDADDQLFCPTVFEDVAFGPRNQKCTEEEVAQRVNESLSATGLTGFESRSTHHLSGGEKKRAAIAAILACRPKILALDEPWANLDARGARAVSKIVREFQGTRVIASQDLYRAADVCDRLVILGEGKVVAHGPMKDLLADKTLLDMHGLEFGQHCRFCPETDRCPQNIPPQEELGSTPLRRSDGQRENTG